MTLLLRERLAEWYALDAQASLRALINALTLAGFTPWVFGGVPRCLVWAPAAGHMRDVDLVLTGGNVSGTTTPGERTALDGVIESAAIVAGYEYAQTRGRHGSHPRCAKLTIAGRLPVDVWHAREQRSLVEVMHREGLVPDRIPAWQHDRVLDYAFENFDSDQIARLIPLTTFTTIESIVATLSMNPDEIHVHDAGFFKCIETHRIRVRADNAATLATLVKYIRLRLHEEFEFSDDDWTVIADLIGERHFSDVLNAIQSKYGAQVFDVWELAKLMPTPKPPRETINDEIQGA